MDISSDLKTKFLKDGYNSLTQDEKLLLLISYSETQKNISNVMERIVGICGGTATAVLADVHFLMNECGSNIQSAVLLNLVLQLKRRCEMNEIDKIELNTAENAKLFFQKFMKGRTQEVFAGVLVDKCFGIKCCEILDHGSVDDVRSTSRNAVAFALKNKSNSIFISHCHPNGSCTPSDADYESTRRIRNALATVGISLVDHIITGVDGVLSLRQENSQIFEENKRYTT
ncbi:MAG: JAB domain-containing protein [Alistipes sp.]|nr:JAB domain-containing protein [Alistipes sp.]